MIKFIIRATLLLLSTFHCVAKESQGVLSLNNYSSPFQSVAFMNAKGSIAADKQN